MNNSFAKKITFIALSFMVGILILSCGKKGDPVCPDVIPPPTVTDLALYQDGDIMELRWTISEYDSNKLRFKIYRSKISVDKQCPACPQRFTLIASLPAHDLIMSGLSGHFCYTDSILQRGFVYSYKLVACKSSGICSKHSNLVKRKFQ